MTDIVGCRQPDRQHVGGVALTQPVFVQQRGGGRDHRTVKVGRAAIDTSRSVGALERVVTDRLTIPVHDFGVARRAMGGNRISWAGLVDFFTNGLVQRGHRRRQAATIERGKSVSFPPIDIVDILAAHHQRRPILAGHRDIARSRRYFLEPLAQCGDQQMPGRSDIIALGRGGNVSETGAVNPLVLRAIDSFVLALDRQIDPVVGDDPGASGMDAGHDCRMTRAGFGCRVRLITRWKHSAAGEAFQAAGEAAAIFVKQVGG